MKKKPKKNQSNDFEKEVFTALGLADGNRAGALIVIKELIEFRAQYYKNKLGMTLRLDAYSGDPCQETPAMYCDHANEVPCSCPCANNCYCKSHTCRSR